jgi:2-polyprenyl-6-methoxyphenol hydroxylase-like FAD-dependent oxidoreductase
MTFHRGQGGNLGIKDAHEVVKAVVAVQKGASLPEAIDSYDEGALLRSEEVEISRQCTMAFLDYENFDSSPLFKMGVHPMSKT